MLKTYLNIGFLLLCFLPSYQLKAASIFDLMRVGEGIEVDFGGGYHTFEKPDEFRRRDKNNSLNSIEGAVLQKLDVISFYVKKEKVWFGVGARFLSINQEQETELGDQTESGEVERISRDLNLEGIFLLLLPALHLIKIRISELDLPQEFRTSFFIDIQKRIILINPLLNLNLSEKVIFMSYILILETLIMQLG